MTKAQRNAIKNGIIPKAPKVPHDYVHLLTYCAGSHETRGEVMCESLTGDTQVDYGSIEPASFESGY